MGVNLHPSQKRSSCEACRKHKLRCKRDEPNAGRCTRCARLDLECVLGQQKKVGRPRRMPTEGVQSSEVASAPFDASSLNFGQAFGGFEGGGFSTPNLDPFFYQAPTTQLSTSGGSGMAPLMDFPFDGSLPWDNISNPFQSASASSGSTPQWSSSASPSISTPISISSAEECRIGFPACRPALSDKPIDSVEAMALLSKLNIDLHIRTATIAQNRDSIDFLTIVCVESLLFLDNMTLVQFMICSTQDFVKMLSRLRATQRDQERSTAATTGAVNMGYGRLPAFSPSPAVDPSSLLLSPQKTPSPGSASEPGLGTAECTSDRRAAEAEPLSPPLYLLITSIFVQMISLYELILYHTASRMLSFQSGPIPEFEEVKFGGMVLSDSCSLGIVFAELVTSLLERSERILGIDAAATDGDIGLLSKSQKESFWRELGGLSGASVGKARAANVRTGLDNAKKAFLEAAMS